MATKVFFNNRQIKLPGAYSTVVSGEKNPPRTLDFGKVLVIDTGSLGATWGGGAGIDGELSEGQDAVYKFDNLADYQNFLKGGLLWKCAEGLFFPDKRNAAAIGVSEVYHVKASTTAAATMTFTATGGGAAGGVFAFKTKDEGVNANGVLTGGATGHLDKGYAYTIETGTVDTAKWILKVWQGTWKGDFTDGISYDGIKKENAKPILIAQSPEFNNMQTLVDWANTSASFGNRFSLTTGTVTGLGTVNSADITAVAGYNVAAGGTETYSTTNLQKVFDAVSEMDFSFVVTDKYGTTDFDSTENESVFAFMNGAQNKYERFFFIGGGQDKDEFAASLAMPSNYDSPYVHIVHGQLGEASQLVSEGIRWWPSIFHAYKVLGRTAGKQPQVPITNKTIGVDKLKHPLTKIEKERALDNGLLVTVYNDFINRFVVLQGVNTMQDNEILFNSAGQSHSIAFMRVIAQVNKELVVNSEIDLLSSENGVNRNTLSPGFIREWTNTYLQSRIAIPEVDNLLLTARNVTVTQVEDYHQVTYEMVVNNEITKIFFTGFLFRN
jgi:hypothetical protein